MKKRILSILLCLCMALTLLPMSALATDYNSWDEATAVGVALTANTDKVTVDGAAYTYKGDASTSGIDIAPSNLAATKALTEACCWKAGSGYVLYKPTVETFTADHPYEKYYTGTFTTSAEVTLHNAQISTASAYALSLPYNSSGADSFPVPVTVKVEGENSLTTTNANYDTLYHQTGDTTFTGGGTLSITGRLQHRDAVTIESGTQVALSGGTSSQIAGNLTVTGNGSKLTIAGDAKLGIGSYGSNPTATVTVKDGGVLENNGTLIMGEQVDKDNSHIVGEISGSGGIRLGMDTTLYCLVDGKFIAYGGDVSTSGLNISGKNADGTDNSAYNAPQ